MARACEIGNLGLWVLRTVWFRPYAGERSLFDIGHSDLFKAEFVKDYWLPYLSNGTIVEGVLDRAPNSWWVSALTVVKLPYAALGLLLVLVLVMWCSGPRCDEKDFSPSRLDYGDKPAPFRVETAKLHRNSDCSVTLSFMPIPEPATFAGKWIGGEKAPKPTIYLEWDSGVNEKELIFNRTVDLSSCPGQQNASNEGDTSGRVKLEVVSPERMNNFTGFTLKIPGSRLQECLKPPSVPVGKPAGPAGGRE